ncbi:NTP transferase domain-containing protein [Clostridium minihomine]|uniref:NTP transferase domain-containing protein n=1 Tax=Clostridium minihomine TaxID=2045012 RepID=UPI000C7614FA|nr:NTP transferase domain-containing protein [Clostridium minihomine]
MRISKVGGLIAAASKQAALPMLQVGTIPIIKRIVISFQQAGIFPIVIITGADEEQVKCQLSNYGVIFISHQQPDHPQLLDSVKMGLQYLYGKCDRIAFTPVNVPMFTPDTLTKLMNTPGEIVTPSYQGNGGHPVMLLESVIPDILAYAGEDGLRGAVQSLNEKRRWVPVEDEGILTSVHNEEQLQARLEEHNDAILHPVIHISIERETAFFDARLKLLLFLISDTRNMRKACEAMALSYGKAWNMINRLEIELGYSVVERRQGGKHGGNTFLTERGEAFLLASQHFEEEVFRFAQSHFQKSFLMTKIMG